jgi:prevent-host-death family protein
MRMHATIENTVSTVDSVSEYEAWLRAASSGRAVTTTLVGIGWRVAHPAASQTPWYGKGEPLVTDQRASKPQDLKVAAKCINLVSMTRTAKSKLTKQPNPRRRVRGNRQPGHWVLQDAKARFSELVRRVRSEGPQHVTVHGRNEVVVISAEEFRRLKGDLTGQALISAMQASPHRDIDIEPRGVRMPVRDVAL